MAIRAVRLAIATALAAFATAGCGGANAHHQSSAEGSTPRSPATGARSSDFAVPLTPTPGAALAKCRRSSLLRAICPRRVPASLDPDRYYLADGCANAPHITISSRRCTLPGWSYEVAAPLPGPSQHIAAWDGTTWVTPSYAPLTPPPYFVHVLIEAAAGVKPPGVPAVTRGPAHESSDALLKPTRARAVSLGWVRWYGHHGQLILEPFGGQSGGELAGHLVFSFASGGVDFAVTLHAWAPEIRLRSGQTSRIIQAPETGPSLPHVIATLKAILGSAPLAA